MDLKQQCEAELCKMPPKLRETIELELPLHQKVIVFEKAGTLLIPNNEKDILWTIVFASNDGIMKIIRFYTRVNHCEQLTVDTNDLNNILKNFKRNFKKMR